MSEVIDVTLELLIGMLGPHNDNCAVYNYKICIISSVKI